MQNIQELFNDEGPSKLMNSIQAKYDAVVSFMDECWQNRVTYEIAEEENHLSDQQLFFLMNEIVTLVGQVLKNKQNA